MFHPSSQPPGLGPGTGRGPRPGAYEEGWKMCFFFKWNFKLGIPFEKAPKGNFLISFDTFSMIILIFRESGEAALAADWITAWKIRAGRLR